MEMELRFTFRGTEKYIPDYCGELDFQYYYILNVDRNVILDYIKEAVIGSEAYRGFTREKQLGIERGIDLMFDLYLVNLNNLLDDDDFREWAEEKYKDDAYKQMKEDAKDRY